jgi:hypothetical protein
VADVRARCVIEDAERADSESVCATDHAAPWRVPQRGSIKTYTQDAINKKDDLFSILNEVFGR